MLGVKPEPSERVDPLNNLAAFPVFSSTGQGNQGRDETDPESQEEEGRGGINRDHLSKELWKTTAQCFRGASKMGYEINNALSFLDELDRTELSLESRIFSLDLVQSVHIPKDASPELITRFVGFTEERGPGLLSLRVEYSASHPKDFLKTVLGNCQNLVRVHIIGFTEIDNAQFFESIAELHLLCDLGITGCKNLDNRLLFGVQPSLISLDLSETNFNGESLINFPFLGRLNLSGCDFYMKNNVILPLVYHCTQLRELTLSNMRNFTEKDFELILISQKALRKLDVSHNAKALTPLSRNIRTLISLKSLNIAFCGEDMSLGALYGLFPNLYELFISGSRLEENLKKDRDARFPNLRIVNLYRDEARSVRASREPQEAAPLKVNHLDPETVKSNNRIRNARHRNKERKKAQEEIQKREVVVASANDSDIEDGDYF